MGAGVAVTGATMAVTSPQAWSRAWSRGHQPVPDPPDRLDTSRDGAPS